MLLLLISVAVTVFLLLAAMFAFFTGKDAVETRLMEVSASAPASVGSPLIKTVPSTGLGRLAAGITSLFSPIRGLISGSDSDLEYKLTLAGFRKPEHMEIFTAIKMLLPVAATSRCALTLS